MRRTRGRPVPAGRVQGADALALGVVLSLFSVGLMALAINLLAAGLLAFTIFFYAVVYTLWLKRRRRRTSSSAAWPARCRRLVGWAAASGTAPLNAWLLVAIIFVWTPPHFWALSLYHQRRLRHAPACRCCRWSRARPPPAAQILIYSLLLVPLALAPAFTGLGGADLPGRRRRSAARSSWPRFGWRSQAGDRRQGRLDAVADAKRALFGFSILYLFALFAALLGEHLSALRPLLAALDERSADEDRGAAKARSGRNIALAVALCWRSSSWSSSSPSSVSGSMALPTVRAADRRRGATPGWRSSAPVSSSSWSARPSPPCRSTARSARPPASTAPCGAPAPRRPRSPTGRSRCASTPTSAACPGFPARRSPARRCALGETKLAFFTVTNTGPTSR